jgi:hypothetical protein
VSRLLFTAGLFAALAWSGRAAADPQGRVAIRAAACGVGDDGKLWQSTRLCSALVGDLLFFRERNRDFGLGPFLEVGSAGFWDARFGGGLSLLAPVTEDFPLVVSVGLYDHELRAASFGATLFWGARSFNFDGNYNWSLGLYASGFRDLDHERDTLVSAGLEIDGFFVAAPFLFAYQALR